MRSSLHLAVVSAVLAGAFAAPAVAKLPAASEATQAAAAAAAAKVAWSNKVAAYQLCSVEDHVAEGYRKSAQAAGKEVPAALPTPPCADPGPYAVGAGTPAAKPLEASGAHSPAATAVAPPSSKATEGEISGAVKK